MSRAQTVGVMSRGAGGHAAVPAGGARELEEIIVTARKRAEPLQKTPVSITRSRSTSSRSPAWTT
jgi:hypothetical protein